jgi:hypothetical protein
MKPGQMAKGTHLQLGLTDTDGIDLPIFAGKHRARSPARSLWGPWGHLTRLRMSSAVLAGFVGLGLACCPGLAAADATVPPKAATTGGLYPGAIALEPETAPETDPEASAPLEPAEPIYLRPQKCLPGGARALAGRFTEGFAQLCQSGGPSQPWESMKECRAMAPCY